MSGSNNTPPPPLSLLNLSSLVSAMAASVQGAATTALDFAVGSVLRAILEASASVALWLQYLLVQTLAATRLATSNGSQVDTFVEDFGLSRLPAVAATGTVTLSRYTATNQAQVVSGGLLKTADGTQSFTIIADTTQLTWSASADAYIIPAGTTSASVTVQADTSGTAGNVLANTITLIASSIPGVDTVTNPGAFANGVNAQTDQQVRNAFTAYINSREEATSQAIEFAVDNLGVNVTSDVITVSPGVIQVVVDNGTGSPPSSLLAMAGSAVNLARAAGIQYSVTGPTMLTANVTMTLTIAAGYSFTTVSAAVQTALATFIDALSIGVALPWSRIGQIAYSASGGVTNVTNVQLNGGTSDIGGSAIQVVRAGTIQISQA